MTFRKATPEDLPVLNKISIQSKKYWGYPDEWIVHWLDELTLNAEKLKAQFVLIGDIENKAAGFCAMTETPLYYEILHLWLLPEFIGKGYGKQLLNHTLGEFVKNEKPVHVEADPNAEAFYKSQGFTTFEKVESYPKGRYLPVMRKE